MTNFSHGREAESAAAEYLKKHGYKILVQNWRTRYCEIDIVAQKANCAYFVEVKYRRTSRQGTGLDYITAKKLSQMRFAAEMWVQENRWKGQYRLAAIEVSDPVFTITNFLSDWL
jgi:Holliday junction resolvase-like predicted endonuclease